MDALPPTKVINYGPQPGPQYDFLATPADIAIFGGAAGGGKSYALLLDHLRWCQLPGYTGIVFRRIAPQLSGAGSIWEEAVEMYGPTGAKLRTTPKRMVSWDSGATIEFASMQYAQDKYNFQGRELAVISFDELTQFEEEQFFYMLSRSRSKCKVRPYVRGTCNPDADSWLAKFIDWWIDDLTGLAIPERSGKLRWFLRHPGTDEILWEDDPDKLPKFKDIRPLSVTFIPSSLDDNPALLSKDPDYRSKLEALPELERARLLGANWKISLVEGAEWPSSYFIDIEFDQLPPDIAIRVTYLDPSKGQREKSDFSALVTVAVSTEGVCYVDSVIERIDVVQLADRTADFLERFPPDYFAVEDNNFQELLQNEIQRACVERRVDVPIMGDTNTKNKMVRIRRLGTLLARGKLKFRRGSEDCSLLISQLRQFPQGQYDDGPDALEGAVRIADQFTEGIPDYYHAEEAEYANAQ